MIRLPLIRSLLGFALVIATIGACSTGVPIGGTVHDLASDTGADFAVSGGGGSGAAGGAAGSGGSGGAAGSGGAGGGTVDMANGAIGQVCTPTCSACSSNPNAGACCGTACCGYGEWCDAATQTCHCGSGATCQQNSFCLSNSPNGTEICGDTCAPIL